MSEGDRHDRAAEGAEWETAVMLSDKARQEEEDQYRRAGLPTPLELGPQQWVDPGLFRKPVGITDEEYLHGLEIVSELTPASELGKRFSDER